MRHTRNAASVTSLPQSPQDEARSRVRHYAITMGIRTVCFVLMAVVYPVGWWTFVFAAGAIFLPYIAVISANAGSDSIPMAVESPVLELDTAPPVPDAAAHTPPVITIHEQHPDTTDAGDDRSGPI
ncbi:Flp pilus assembly protein TadB [Microbacterium sp. W4I4]|uniref:DUF3099 domain-containing protein n=1 Tax=Microbacterium sp. W4I4 TaxID=3042295 RepID=UPI0027861C4F|nr:DUF3099 domain-containing protein [Microbacterium sp. W4I4]MDQ0612669.1 Flp pilus assembly protein TadB [Microbacterium sp. W4I4]